MVRPRHGLVGSHRGMSGMSINLQAHGRCPELNISAKTQDPAFVLRYILHHTTFLESKSVDI